MHDACQCSTDVPARKQQCAQHLPYLPQQCITTHHGRAPSLLCFTAAQQHLARPTPSSATHWQPPQRSPAHPPRLHLPPPPQGLPVTRLIITGCPLPSINRILERGLVTFPVTLEALEVHECAFRGDNLSIVTRKIKKHPALQSIKVRRGLVHGTSVQQVAGAAAARAPGQRWREM